MAEANVAKVANGQPAEVTVEAIPDRRYKAVLRQVIPTADRTKATVQVKVTILEKDEDLKPEMSAKVTFLEPEKKAGRRRRPRPRSCSSPGRGRLARRQVAGVPACARARRSAQDGEHGSGAAGAGRDPRGALRRRDRDLAPAGDAQGRRRRPRERTGMMATTTESDARDDARAPSARSSSSHGDGRREGRAQGLPAGQPGDPRPERDQPPGQGGRLRGPHGSLRLRQDDAPEPDRGHRPPHLGPGGGGGDRRGPAQRERARELAQPQRRLHLPVLQPHPRPERHRERGAAAPPHQPLEEGAAGARAHRPQGGRPRRSRPPLPAAALRAARSSAWPSPAPS